jgi:hypothetical protein
MLNRAYKRYENIEFIIAANNTSFKIQFQDIPQLRSDTTKEIFIRSIRVFSTEDALLSYNQNPQLSLAELKKCFLTLYVDSEESIYRIPLTSLVATAASAGSGTATDLTWSNGEMQFSNIEVDWTKSYITLSAALTSSALQSIMFGIGYIRCAPGTSLAMRTQERNAAASGLLNFQ